MNEALCKFYTTSQDNSDTWSEYLKKFHMVVDEIKPVGGYVGNHPEFENEVLKKMDMKYPRS